MTGQRQSKINQILRQWPEGTVGTLDWLSSHGVSRRLADWHVRSHWLDRLGPRAFVRGGDSVDWKGGVYALQQQLGMTVHVGGRSALEMQGRSHFVPLGQRDILLVSDKQERLPSWFSRHDWAVKITHRCVSLFSQPPESSLHSMPCGRFAVRVSASERAIMEVLYLAQENFEIEHAHELMSGLTTLRPDVLQALLESCASVKVKRLFLWSAETAGHAWFARLNRSTLDLGKGKRQLYKGGRWDPKYGITVPAGTESPHV